MAPQKKLLFVIFVLVSVSLACGALTPPTPTEPPPPTPTFTPLPPTNTPEPTATLAPTNTPQPTATPVPKPGDVIFSENFDDNSNRWGSFSSADSEVSVVAGVYSVQVKKNNTIYSLVPAASVASFNSADVDISFDATAKEGNFKDLEFGASCRREEDTKNYYLFTISGEGNYRIERRFNNAWTTLVGPAFSNVIRSGYSTNNIRIICVGDTLRLVVNGQTLFTTKDTTLTKGKGFSLNASNYTSPATRVTFDNVVARLPDISQLQPITTGGTSATVQPTAAGATGVQPTQQVAQPTATTAAASSSKSGTLLQTMRVLSAYLGALIDGLNTGGIYCGPWRANYEYVANSIPATIDVSGEAANVLQAASKYQESRKAIVEGTREQYKWCGTTTPDGSIPYTVWNPTQGALNSAFIYLNEALNYWAPPNNRLEEEKI